MSWYVDISVRGVQSYLARSTHEPLQSARAASARLVAATDSHRVAEKVRAKCPDVRVNDEAVATDETVNLRLPDSAGHKGAQRAATAALLEVRRKLPAATLQAVFGQGRHYFEAYPRALGPAFAHGGGVLSPAAAADVLPAARCELCSQEHVTGGTVILVGEEEERQVCAECAQRHRRDLPSRSEADGRAAQDRLIHALGGETKTGRHAKDFEELAEQGQRSDNHLATVYADANGLGAAFAELLGKPVGDDSDPGRPARKLSHIVKKAVDGALRSAAQGLCRPKGVFPVQAHIVGGDDVLVTVPAEHGLPFARDLTQRFTEAVCEGLDAEGDAAAQPSTPLTMSAAVVIAHRSFPFLRCTELAGGLLDDAKTLGQGKTAMLNWLLVTQEGNEPPAGRNAWPVDALDAHQDDLARLASRPQHARKQLARAAAHSQPKIAEAYVRRLVRRDGNLDEVERVLDARGVQGVKDALSLALWWPPAAEPAAPVTAAQGVG